MNSLMAFWAWVESKNLWRPITKQVHYTLNFCTYLVWLKNAYFVSILRMSDHKVLLTLAWLIRLRWKVEMIKMLAWFGFLCQRTLRFSFGLVDPVQYSMEISGLIEFRKHTLLMNKFQPFLIQVHQWFWCPLKFKQTFSVGFWEATDMCK